MPVRTFALVTLSRKTSTRPRSIKQYCLALSFALVTIASTSCRAWRSDSASLKDITDGSVATGQLDPESRTRLNRLVALIRELRQQPGFPKVEAAVRDSARHAAAQAVNGLTILQLEAIVTELIKGAKGSVAQLQGHSPEKEQALIKQLADSLAAEAAHHLEFSSWETVERYLNAILADGGSDAASGSASFIRNIERLARTSFVAYTPGPPTAECRPVDAEGRPRNSVGIATCLLHNGEAAFAARDRIIAGARRSIWIASWAIYNDYTGKLYARMLIDKKRANPNLDIRVAVDGATAGRPFYREVVQQLADAQIPVLHWRRADQTALRGYGLHRKMLIVDHGTDNASVIIGGMNYGDEYSHINPQSTAAGKWRDADLLLVGAAASNQAANIFGTTWNRFAEATGKVAPIHGLPAAASAEVSGENRIAFIDHEPSASVSTFEGKKVTYDPIYLATLRAIKGAQRSIDIGNAYYIATNPLENALIAAAKRGVRVRIHTNSKESVDDANLIRPILEGLDRLKTAGGSNVEIYLRKVSTLHSKYMVVDANFGWVGSYNLHPRSYWYEGETVLAFTGSDFGSKIREMFEQDIANAAEAKLATDADLAVPSGQTDLTEIFAQFFFNLL